MWQESKRNCCNPKIRLCFNFRLPWLIQLRIFLSWVWIVSLQSTHLYYNTYLEIFGRFWTVSLLTEWIWLKVTNIIFFFILPSSKFQNAEFDTPIQFDSRRRPEENKNELKKVLSMNERVLYVLPSAVNWLWKFRHYIMKTMVNRTHNEYMWYGLLILCLRMILRTKRHICHKTRQQHGTFFPSISPFSAIEQPRQSCQ